MKIQWFCLLAFVLYICIVSEPSVFAQTNKSNQFLTNESPRNYDVIQYDLYVDWMNIMHSTKNEPEKRQWNGEIKIKLTPLEDNFSVVELDAVMLQINEVLIDGEPSLPKYSDNILTVLVPTMNIGDTTLIQINYTYNNPYNIGFFHRNSLDKYPEGWENEIDIPIASMLSEPQNARYWMPCNDRPNDKSLVRVVATVPYGMIAASNGSLDSTAIIYKENVPYSETFYWSSKHTMPTYLMTIAASEYQLHKEKMPTSSNNNDSVDVYYYTWRDDWEGNQNYNLSRIAAATPKTMLIFSDLFGDYPFEKYGVVTVDYTLLGYKSIGMEHQTLTTVSRDWIVNHILVPEFTSFAHELAHSWFGNMVTCHTWKDVWFNEGGASWLEAIYLENIRNYVDTAAYYNHMKNYRTTYLRNKQNNFNLSLCLDDNTDAFSNTSIIYAKAAWLFHHLRVLLGDDVFTLFKQMLEQHKFGTITSQEFIDFFVQNVQNPPNNVDMKRFLQQFIYQAGHPIYNLSTNVVKVDNGYNVNVLLEQTQVADKVPAEFLMNLNIKFLDEHNNVIRSEFIINDSRQQTYSFNLDAIPTNVILDTTKALLEVNKNVLIDNISFNENHDNILIYPNPINTEQITIKFQPDNILKQQIEIVDITGKNHTANVININNNTIIVETQNLIAGTYLIVINGSNVCKIVKL